MKKAVLLVSLLPCFAVGAAAESLDVKEAELAVPGDARVVVLDKSGPVVTDLKADAPEMAPNTLNQSSALKPTDPVMREGDALVREPLVARLGVDRGEIVRTDPIPIAVKRVVPVEVVPAPTEDGE
ncbi:hypothetical protein [Hyphomonas sp.]|jgi:hypothetical protein|uniref:hypothetical protein n=1 Tax=Hyphomonas sp. TaxID=87 RepID=UPI0032D96A66